MIKKLSKIILMSLIVIATGCGSLPTIETVDSYMIAYIENVTGRARIRYAGEDPTAQWMDGGAIEGGSLPITSYLGTGLGSYPDGGTAVLGALEGNRIELRLGIGPFFSKDTDDTLPYAARSSPSFAHIGGSEYMIAYQIFDPDANVQIGWVDVIPWDPSPGSDVWDGAGQMFVLGDGQYSYDDYLVGRPAIAYLKEKQLLLVIWNRSGATVDNPNAPPPSTVQYALGTYPFTDRLNTIVNWTKYGELNLLAFGEHFAGSPSLTTDGENFYLGITLVRYGDLNSWNEVVYKSPDGLNWTQVTEQQCPAYTYYADIAVQPNGDMLVGCISNGQQNFHLKRDGIWINLDEKKVLGGVPLTTGDDTNSFGIETFKLQTNK